METGRYAVRIPSNMSAYLTLRVQERQKEAEKREQRNFHLTVFGFVTIATILLWIVGCR